MRRFFSQATPKGSRILLIESGSRGILEKIIDHLNNGWARGMEIDLLTCYAGLPAGLQPGGRVYRTSEYSTSELRAGLARELAGRDYAYAGMICSAEPVMGKWKWWLAWKVPAKFFIINENADYFWLNREHSDTIRRFIFSRTGMSEAGVASTLGRLALFPFGVAYLALYAAAAHSMRRLRTKT